MRQALFLVVLFMFVGKISAQEFIAGLTADYNSGIGERYTYGVGLHTEIRIKKSNWYFNWHYGAGSNTHGEFYAHAGLPVLLYKSEDWWDTPVDDWEGALGLLLGPVICPSGITYYTPRQVNKDYRLGIYCNPLALDYWQMQPYKVASWTVESGAKFLWYMSDQRLLYIAGGVSFTNNIRRGYRWYGNETLVGLQIGLLGYAD